MVGALALFQMGSAVVQGVYQLGQLGKDIDVIGMLVLLVASALLPLSCGSWRATYAHPYIHTRESVADDDDGDGGDGASRVDDRSLQGRRLRCGGWRACTVHVCRIVCSWLTTHALLLSTQAPAQHGRSAITKSTSQGRWMDLFPAKQPASCMWFNMSSSHSIKFHSQLPAMPGPDADNRQCYSL